jgi:tetratricopeptide (TPR) repeat protein
VWLSFVPFYAIGVAVFFVAERYRLPLFIPLCVCAGGAVDALLRMFSTSIPRARIAGAVAVTAAGCGVAVTAYPFPLNDGRYEERLAASKVLMNRHDYAGAAGELQRAFELQPANTVTEFNLGMALVTAGRRTEGVSHLRHAVEAGVPIKGARYANANAVLATGDRQGAIMLLRSYYPAADDDAESCLHVAELALNAGAPRVAERYLVRALELRPGWPEAADLLRRLRE